MQGWIKLHRKIRQNPIFNDMELYRLATICLTEAYHKETDQPIGNQVVRVLPGQFITGRFDLHDMYNAGLKPKQKVSEKTVWRWLEKLEKLDFLTIKSTNKYSVVSITNWSLYQNDDQQNDQQMTNKCPTDDQQMTTNKNVKNVKNEKNDKEKIPYVEIVDHLNHHAESKFSNATKKTRELIKARFNEGFTEQDFCKVIEYCCKEWKGKTFANGQTGDNYLRPSTLFNNKFDERLQKANSTSNVKPFYPKEVNDDAGSNGENANKFGNVRLYK